MKTITLKKLFVVATVALASASCGDNLKAPDAKVADAHNVTPCSDCPAVPVLGVQMDRLGRPAINTALNHAFDGTTAAGPAKDAYNQDGSPGGWTTQYVAPFMTSLGFIDALDSTAVTDGCGTQVEYNGTPQGGGTPTAMSYGTIATVLANDQLFLDTTHYDLACEIPSSHANYLAVEFNYVTGLPESTCGGRAPTNDVIDASYTALAIGIAGFSPTDFAAAFGDGAGPHADVSNDTFPFLGAPH